MQVSIFGLRGVGSTGKGAVFDFSAIFWSHYQPLGLENISNLIKYLLLGTKKNLVITSIKSNKVTGIKSRKNKTKRKQSPRVVNCFLAAEKLLKEGETQYSVQLNSNGPSSLYNLIQMSAATNSPEQGQKKCSNATSPHHKFETSH